MSDSLRQGTGDKLASNLKPDSQKSTLESVTDSAKSNADSLAGKVQPDSEKGAGQKISDTVGSGSKDASQQGEGVLKQAQDTVNSGLQQASDALGLNQKK